MQLSIIIPIYNEQGNILNLDKEIKEEVTKLFSNFEIIYINDGSTDKSLDELKTLNDITIINLNKNYGQSVAFDAGFKHASGDLVVTMDGDGQNDPKDIKNLLEKLQKENLDVVAGFRKYRKDKNNIKILTKIGRFLRKNIIGDIVNDQGCSLRIYTKEAIKSLDIGGEMHRYILAILKWKGFKIGEVIVNDRARIHGKSKYNYTKAVRGFIDLIYIWFIQKYSQRPLHFFGYMSITAFFFGIITSIWTIYGKMILGLSLNRNGWFFITSFLFIASIMLFSFGIIIDILIKISLNNSPYEKRYYIRDVINK